jgi:predicted DNA-binding transcriptional regulator AlpA
MSQQNSATLDIKELATLLHLSPATVRSDVSRRPWVLPPSIKVGIRTVWLRSTVLDWLKARERTATQPTTTPQPRAPGHPKKLDQLKQQAAKALP